MNGKDIDDTLILNMELKLPPAGEEKKTMHEIFTISKYEEKVLYDFIKKRHGEKVIKNLSDNIHIIDSQPPFITTYHPALFESYMGKWVKGEERIEILKDYVEFMEDESKIYPEETKNHYYSLGLSLDITSKVEKDEETQKMGIKCLQKLTEFYPEDEGIKLKLEELKKT